MPDLDITSADGELLPDAAALTLAVMLFPLNREKQLHVIALAASKEQILPADDLFGDMARYVFAQGGTSSINKAAHDGANSGFILRVAIRLIRHAANHATLSRVLYAARTDLEVNDRTIRGLWSQFKNVAHLWCAYQLYPDGLIKGDLMEFLGLAMSIADEAQAHEPLWRKAPNFLPDPFVPDGLSVPRFEIIDDAFPPLLNKEQQIIDSYRKPSTTP